jgi:hypothetical protein
LRHLSPLALAAIALLQPGAARAQAPEPAAQAPGPSAGAPQQPSSQAPAAAEARVDPLAGATPMAERVATIAVLNKQNGRVQDFELKPGSSVRFERLAIHLRACETTPPWEQKLTGAFVQMDERAREGRSARVFSGWLFAEAPGLNVFENPVYDVWVRSCAMSFPDMAAGDEKGRAATARAASPGAPSSGTRPSRPSPSPGSPPGE